MPTALSASVMNSELVSMRDDVSSSLPMARIAARRNGGGAHANTSGKDAISPRSTRLP